MIFDQPQFIQINEGITNRSARRMPPWFSISAFTGAPTSDKRGLQTSPAPRRSRHPKAAGLGCAAQSRKADRIEGMASYTRAECQHWLWQARARFLCNTRETGRHDPRGSGHPRGSQQARSSICPEAGLLTCGSALAPPAWHCNRSGSGRTADSSKKNWCAVRHSPLKRPAWGKGARGERNRSPRPHITLPTRLRAYGRMPHSQGRPSF